MCGIVGFFNSESFNQEEASNVVNHMTSRLIHRGPDAGSVWVDASVALGHRRLSILDLTSAGAQPMLSDTEKFVLAFNGEIYNHLEMRAELEEEGVAPIWRGHSDTETLLAGFTRWGIDDTLKRANGMFALAVWNRHSRVLSLARDRIGEKPLYWGWCQNAVVFSSELKAMRAYPGFPNEICRNSLVQYLRFSYVPAPRSIHPGIYKLEPGCILEIDGTPPSRPPVDPLRPDDRFGSVSIRRYWSVTQSVELGQHEMISSESEAIEATTEVLKAAVGRQMLSDVPLGAFLSGGIDSSIIVALMQEQSSKPVKTFTVGFENKAYDESKFAAAVARHLETDHHEIIVTETNALDLVPILPEMFDEPFADSSQIPTHLVCRAARQHVKVALSGDGGDELFGGYNRYFWGPAIWNRTRKIPMPIKIMLGTIMVNIPVSTWDGIGGVYNGFKIGSNGISNLGDKAHKLGSRLRSVRSDEDLYRSLIDVWDNPLALVRGGWEVKSLLDDPLPSFLNSGPANLMMFQDMRTYLPDDILCKVDRSAMAVGLETRVPFLDLDVVALSSRIPVDMKIRGTVGKVPLRKILHGYVPKELIERPKMGFGIPVGEW
jgi:asparagine synthase (glutamine-hydrolysing)